MHEDDLPTDTKKRTPPTPHTVHKNNRDFCSISQYVLTSFLLTSLFTSICEILILCSTLKVGVRINHSHTASPRWNTD